MLKELLLRKKLEAFNNSLEELTEKIDEIKKREEELAEDIRNSTEELSDEDKKVIEDEADSIEKQKEELENKKKELEAQIEEVNQAIKELEDKKDVVNEYEEEKREVKNTSINTREGLGMNLERREQLRQLVQNEENRQFFGRIKDLVMREDPKTTTLTGKELLIPKEVMAAINQEIIGYGEVIKLVHRIQIKGETRIVFNAGTPKLFWTEKCASLKEATLGEFREIELDNFKLGGYVFLCKAFIEDAIIDIADYVIKEFAKAIAIALDEAIINGEGAESKQPEGILTVVEDSTNVSNLVQVLGLVGTLNPVSKNITLVTNRKTYYSNILPETYGKNAQGKIVYGLGQTLPDGTKIVISEAVKGEGEFIIGDFYQGYKLGERMGMQFDTSDQVRWIEEQIGYKTSGRYDGKVADKTFFVRGKFVQNETVEDESLAEG